MSDTLTWILAWSAVPHTHSFERRVGEDLIAIRDLLSDPARWTQILSARRADGDYAWPRAPEAVRWCLVGAAQRMSTTYLGSVISLLARVLASDERDVPTHLEMLRDPYATVAAWNDADGRTHAEVLALIDRAIEEAATDERP